jgi:hypothetical protein
LFLSLIACARVSRRSSGRPCFGERPKRCRLEALLNQEEFAYRLGCGEMPRANSISRTKISASSTEGHCAPTASPPHSIDRAADGPMDRAQQALVVTRQDADCSAALYQYGRRHHSPRPADLGALRASAGANRYRDKAERRPPISLASTTSRDTRIGGHLIIQARKP